MSTENKTKDQAPNAPKTEQTSSGAAAHNPFAPFTSFDPMQAWGASQAAFQKMMTDAYGRAQAWADEYASMEKQMFSRANQAVDTWAQLAHDTIAYSQQLSAQARKLGFEAARKASFVGA
jgi:hypothetical protein